MDHVRRCAVSRHRTYMALKSFSFSFSFCFFVFYYIRLLYRILFSLSSHSLISLGFWCTSFYHHPEFLCYLSAISPTYPRFFRFFRIAWRSCFCIAIVIYLFFPSHSAGSSFYSVQHFSFSSRLVSFRLFSDIVAPFLILCSLSFFLLCYGMSSSPLSVSVSLLSLCFLFVCFYL